MDWHHDMKEMLLLDMWGRTPNTSSVASNQPPVIFHVKLHTCSNNAPLSYFPLQDIRLDWTSFLFCTPYPGDLFFTPFSCQMTAHHLLLWFRRSISRQCSTHCRGWVVEIIYFLFCKMFCLQEWTRVFITAPLKVFDNSISFILPDY